MMVTVWGSVPVAVVVDTETEMVERVVIGDEEFRRSGLATGDDLVTPVPPGAAQCAMAVVDDPSVEWPSWEFGW